MIYSKSYVFLSLLNIEKVKREEYTSDRQEIIENQEQESNSNNRSRYQNIGYKLSYQVIKEDVKNFVCKPTKPIDISFAIFY